MHGNYRKVNPVREPYSLTVQTAHSGIKVPFASTKYSLPTLSIPFSNGVKKQGFVLVSIIILIVLAAIVLSVSMYLLNEIVSAERVQLTWQRLRGVEARVMGHRFLCHNDAGSNTGNFSETTTFPGVAEADLDNLMADVDAFKRSDGDSLAAEDAYGKIDLTESATVYQIVSYGRDKAEGGTGDDGDRSLSITKSYRTGCDIAVRIVDASVSGNVTVTGDNDDYFVNGNTSDLSGSDVQWGHTILDSADLTVCLYHPPDFDASVEPTILTYQTEAMSGPTKYFTADNISYGYHRLIITPFNTDTLDPPWQGESGGSLSNVLSTYIFLYPTTERQRFNVVYPVIAKAYGLREKGDTSAEVHQDKMVDNSGNDYNYLDPDLPLVENDPYEYLVVGRGNLFGSGQAAYRALLKFALTEAGGLPGISSSSKVVFAELILFNDTARGAGVGIVEVHRFTNGNWGESTTDHAWADMANYSDKQDEQYFASPPPAYLAFDVTQAVQEWVVTDWSNYGFLVRTSVESTDSQYYVFKCQESDTSSNDIRPRLVVAYYK